MKKLIVNTVLVLSCVVWVSCSDKKDPNTGEEPILRPASMYYSAQDSAAINTLINQYVDLLKQQDIEGAVGMLTSYKNKTIQPLDENARKGMINALSVFNIYDARANAIMLEDATNNRYDVLVQIKQDGSLNEERGVIHFELNPILVDGQWYLTYAEYDPEAGEQAVPDSTAGAE